MNDGVKIVAKLGSALRLNSNHLVIHKNPHYFLKEGEGGQQKKASGKK